MSSIALTPTNKQTLKRLLKTGRWGNESEIVRYGIHLVEMEVQAKQKELWPKPISDAVMRRIYRGETKKEKAVEEAFAKHSRKLIKAEPFDE